MAEEENEYDLCEVLDRQVSLLKQLQRIDLSGVYEAFEEDKIKCITRTFKVISAVQDALIRDAKKVAKQNEKDT
jgi:hypothetical protein